MRDINNTGYEFSALAVQTYADHAVARTCVTATYVDLRATAKLFSSGSRFISTPTKLVFPFDVRNDAPNSVRVFHCGINHVWILQSGEWHNGRDNRVAAIDFALSRKDDSATSVHRMVRRSSVVPILNVHIRSCGVKSGDALRRDFGLKNVNHSQ